MELLFGEAAETAERGASERLRRWCAAFDAWLGERKATKPSTVEPAELAWRQLLRRRPKMPWELTRADFEAYVRTMQAEGYAASRIAQDLGYHIHFYRWCDAHSIDPDCQGSFNPAEGIKRPHTRRSWGGKQLSREQAARLLQVMGRDTSELGKRDHAFILARLRLGVPLGHLQKLKWGQIEQEGEGVFVRWREGVERAPLPDEVWQAIRAALEAGGRLAGMRAEDYIFAPLAEPWNTDAGSKREDWKAERHLSTEQLIANYQLYGRLAGIPEAKLTLQVLRDTATRLRLDEGANLDEMRAFLDSQEKAASFKYRMGKLPQLPEDEGLRVFIDNEAGAPNRKSNRLKPEDTMTHGMYARTQPHEQVAAILAQDIKGIEEQIVGLRTLGRGMVTRQGEARSSQEAARLGEGYSLAAYRLGELFRAEQELAKKGKSSQWAEEILAALSRIAVETGEEPIPEQSQQQALGGESEMVVVSRRLVEEIAALRAVLRNVFRLALEAEQTGEYLRMAEIYGSGCVRLVRLLKLEQAEGGQLEAHLQNEIERAILDLNREWGLS